MSSIQTPSRRFVNPSTLLHHPSRVHSVIFLSGFIMELSLFFMSRPHRQTRIKPEEAGFT